MKILITIILTITLSACSTLQNQKMDSLQYWEAVNNCKWYGVKDKRCELF